jgi:hypothetical protein
LGSRSRRAEHRAASIAAVAALTLVAVAAAGMRRRWHPGPNGCPTNKSLKTAPIADLAPPARTQIEAFDVCPPINAGTQTSHEGTRGEHLRVDIKAPAST